MELELEIQEIKDLINKTTLKAQQLNQFALEEQTKHDANFFKITQAIDEVTKLKEEYDLLMSLLKKKEYLLVNPYRTQTPLEKYIEDLIKYGPTSYINLDDYKEYPEGHNFE